MAEITAVRRRGPGAAKRAPSIAAIVLAAGRSSRFAPENKLLAEFEGAPMITRAVEAALLSKAAPVLVVVGSDADRMRAVLGGRDVTIVENPRFAEGLSSSLRAGLAALPQGVDGAVVLLGDMPRVGAHHIDRLIAAFDPSAGRAICVPIHRGRRGNPVLWSAAFFPEMEKLRGDCGARELIDHHAARAAEVEMPDDSILFDVDTPATLAELRPGAAERASAPNPPEVAGSSRRGC
ncbi:MAG TPA: hypothetical protein DEP35_12255 [Deltaproteobacteria bacterium]|nr:hypothetical protein [Deltaproteobacteria bacterium]